MANKSKFIDYIDEALEKSKETALSRLFFTYHGIPYPITMCTSETFNALDTFEARSDDIVLASYPKCGSNWILHIISELIFAESKKKYEYPEFPILECEDPEKYQRMKQFPSPRILTTHLHYDKLAGSIFNNKAKILVIFQNPKDTAVSFFHFHNDIPDIPSCGSWGEFFRQFMKGRFLLYEDLKKNLAAGIQQIAEFLGFSLTGEQIQTSQGTHGAVGPFLFQHGEVGDWKILFSETQNQEMDAKFKACLTGISLGAKLKYESYCQA
ncbi:unnamed protein product [Nyctereutes procyonoides]|uniref:Sulfotransferase n=1 Tax=Nyctereutes procyonoides TaxID=34880 RepID=A0A811Z6X1_NYCPR|nr:unnamed protein product [Nyctereutes procyonoides]